MELGIAIAGGCDHGSVSHGTAADHRSQWLDDFDGPAGTAPDADIWSLESGGGGWGDQQVQHYAPGNASLTGGGCLEIVARREPSPRGTGTITSARLVTKSRLTVQYGRIEARIKVPTGEGVWPAFWALGADIDDVGWPRCGEIDVMEYLGGDPQAVHGTVHGPGYAGVGLGFGRRLETPSELSDDFHDFAVSWGPDEIRWHLDGYDYHRVTPTDVPGPWPFRHPFYLLLNLAVGGNWPGHTAHATLPAVMLVDWVRVTDSIIRPAHRAGATTGGAGSR